MPPREKLLAWEWNLPNAVTLARVFIFPVLLVTMSRPGPRAGLISALLLGVGLFSDWLDGHLARRNRTVTAAGKLLDPLADKIMVTTALIMLVELGRTPGWITAVILAREMAITGLRTFAAAEGLLIAASMWGKSKTFFQGAAILGLAVHYPYLGINAHAVGTAFLYVALALTLYSGADYIFRFIGILRKRAPGSSSNKEA